MLCLLLFLWVAFGGPTPLAPKSYRLTANFPEATQLAKESDVRIGGVSVGKVKTLSLPKTGNTTRATIELKPEFAPLSTDAKAILRQKTLLGETYVELTRGSAGTGSTSNPQALVGSSVQGSTIPEGGHLANTQVQDPTQIDEIFNALDPQTRQNFRLWQLNAAVAVNGRGLDINDAIGNLGPFAQDAAQVLGTLRRQDKALGDLVNHTGGVFQALSERGNELAGAISGTNATFAALASRDKALSETIRIFPTFNHETRLTLDRLTKFSLNADPLIKDLKPVAADLSPTLASIRRLSPKLRSLFIRLGPLLTAAETGLPALQATLTTLAPGVRGPRPVPGQPQPDHSLLALLRDQRLDFLDNPPAALGGHMDPALTPNQPSARHFLRQVSYMSQESLSVYPTRLSSNRGNGYLLPNLTVNGAAGGIFPNFDCKPTATADSASGQDPSRERRRRRRRPRLLLGVRSPAIPPTSRLTSAASRRPRSSRTRRIWRPRGGESWVTSRTPRRSTTRSASCSRTSPRTRSSRRSSARRTRSSSTTTASPTRRSRCASRRASPATSTSATPRWSPRSSCRWRPTRPTASGSARSTSPSRWRGQIKAEGRWPRSSSSCR